MFRKFLCLFVLLGLAGCAGKGDSAPACDRYADHVIALRLDAINTPEVAGSEAELAKHRDTMEQLWGKQLRQQCEASSDSAVRCALSADDINAAKQCMGGTR